MEPKGIHNSHQTLPILSQKNLIHGLSFLQVFLLQLFPSTCVTSPGLQNLLDLITLIYSVKIMKLLLMQFSLDPSYFNT